MNHAPARTCVSTLIGPVTVTASCDGVRRIAFGTPGEGERVGRDTEAAAAHLDRAVRQIEEYFADRRTSFSVELDWAGVDSWPLRVLTYLNDTVRYGETITYGALAALNGRPQAAQAVGAIMSRNPLPIVVPCHRVVAADSLGGFAGSRGAQVETKRRLLQLEGAVAPTLF